MKNLLLIIILMSTACSWEHGLSNIDIPYQSPPITELPETPIIPPKPPVLNGNLSTLDPNFFASMVGFLYITYHPYHQDHPYVVNYRENLSDPELYLFLYLDDSIKDTFARKIHKGVEPYSFPKDGHLALSPKAYLGFKRKPEGDKINIEFDLIMGTFTNTYTATNIHNNGTEFTAIPTKVEDSYALTYEVVLDKSKNRIYLKYEKEPLLQWFVPG